MKIGRAFCPRAGLRRIRGIWATIKARGWFGDALAKPCARFELEMLLGLLFKQFRGAFGILIDAKAQIQSATKEDHIDAAADQDG